MMDDEYGRYDDLSVASAARRRFLTAAVATVTVAAATGGAAAVLLDDDPQTTAKVASTAMPLPSPSTPEAASDATYLLSRLTALEAENSTLQSNLAAAQRQLASYSALSADSSTSDSQGWRHEYEEASAQAAELSGRVGVLEGLLAMYEELDAVDVAAAAAGGVAAVGEVIGGLVAEAPSVAEGLQAGRQALEEFEEQLPLIEQGRDWLEGQMSIVGRALESAESALKGALEVGGTFLQLLDRWFEDMLKWLPFGIGQKALTIVGTVTGLLGVVPETLDGLQTNIAGPLDLWLGRDGDEIRLRRRMIGPIREQALDRADRAVEGIGSLDDTYEVELRHPIATLVERQRVIREQIVNYRKTNAV
ncbi:MAG: hypothetical protein JSW55_03400 [Chloroflexota bacterium]|nr:MAG: hypothetical protein JSW55_03400 [Chloroflexota bacterium]